MIEMSLFYNQAACQDVLILVADESSYPTEIETFGDVVVLKEDGRIIGINIFHALEYVKIKAGGLLYSVNDQLAKLVHDIVKDYSGYDIAIIDNYFILGQIKKDKEGDIYSIDIGKETTVEALSAIGELSLGDYVEVTFKETRLPTGHKAYHYLKGQAEYLITARDLKPDICGTRLYILEGGKRHVGN